MMMESVKSRIQESCKLLSRQLHDHCCEVSECGSADASALHQRVWQAHGVGVGYSLSLTRAPRALMRVRCEQYGGVRVWLLLCNDFPTCTANRRARCAGTLVGTLLRPLAVPHHAPLVTPSSAHAKLGRAAWPPQKELVGRAECGGIAVFSLSLSPPHSTLSAWSAATTFASSSLLLHLALRVPC
jgi:hypothetical protein